MSGIKREISPDPRPSLIDRHLPNTPQVQRLLRREGKAHVFNDRWSRLIEICRNLARR